MQVSDCLTKIIELSDCLIKMSDCLMKNVWLSDCLCCLIVWLSDGLAIPVFNV